jgi:hypothetical protein
LDVLCRRRLLQRVGLLPLTSGPPAAAAAHQVPVTRAQQFVYISSLPRLVQGNAKRAWNDIWDLTISAWQSQGGTDAPASS